MQGQQNIKIHFAKLRNECAKYVPKSGRTIVGETDLPVKNRCGYMFYIQGLRFYRRPV